jgi:hypothetical protein
MNGQATKEWAGKYHLYLLSQGNALRSLFVPAYSIATKLCSQPVTFHTNETGCPSKDSEFSWRMPRNG